MLQKQQNACNGDIIPSYGLHSDIMTSGYVDVIEENEVKDLESEWNIALCDIADPPTTEKKRTEFPNWWSRNLH